MTLLSIVFTVEVDMCLLLMFFRHKSVNWKNSQKSSRVTIVTLTLQLGFQVDTTSAFQPVYVFQGERAFETAFKH